MATPTSAALDQFLRDSYDVVQAVHRRLDVITAVADHLTPVEDLVEFRHEVTALHNKLGLLVAASELIVRASEAGINLLLAPDPAAQRQLLGLRSAALHEASYFATQEAFLELQAWVTQLSARLDQAFAELATKVSREELDAILQPILVRLADLEDGIDIGLGETNSRLTLLISQLEGGEYNRALASALEALTTRVTQTETGLVTESGKLTALQSEVTDLGNQVAGNATAVNQLLTRVESSDEGIDALSRDYTRLSTEVGNLATGQTANTEALQLLQSHTSTQGASIESHGLALTQLSGTINDVLHGANLTADAISGLETRMTSNEAGQLALSTQYDQLASRVTDTETGTIAGATAREQLLTRVEQTENALTIAAEDRTHLKASLTSTGNHLPNAGFAVDLRGWSLFARGDGWLDAQLTRNLQPSEGTLPAGINALGLFQDEVPTGAAGVRSTRIPVEDLAGYLLSGYLAAENCTVRLEWRVLNAAGVEIGFGLAGSSSSPPSNRLSDWDRVHGPLDIPAEGTSVEVQWWVDDCHTGWPRAWLVRPMLEPRHGSQEGPSPWMEGVHGLEESFAEATQLLETRLTQTEESIEAVSRALTELDAQLGTGQEWRIVNHAGSDDYVVVGSPLPPGLYRPGEEAPVHAFERGLTLLRFGEDGNLATAERFDTFANVSERERLANTLGLLSTHDAFVLVSQDHHGVKLAGLTEVLEDCGALNFANLVGSRPYILAGRPGLGKGGGIEVAAPVSRPWNDFILTLVNGTPQGLGGQSGVADLLVGQAGTLQELQAQVVRNGEDMTAISSDLVDLSARLDTSESGLTAQSTALQELTSEVSRIDGVVVSQASSLGLLGAKNADGSAFIFDLDKTRVSPTESLGQRLLSIQSSFGDVNSRIDDEAQARSDADSAQVGRISTMEGRMPTGTDKLVNTATLTAVENASVTRDNALADRALAMESRMPTGTDKLVNTATLTQTQQTLANATSAVASDLALLGAKTSDGQSFQLNNSKVLVDVNQSLAQWRQSLQTQFGEHSSRMDTMTQTQADDHSAAVSRLEAMEASTGGTNLLENSDFSTGDLESWNIANPGGAINTAYLLSTSSDWSFNDPAGVSRTLELKQSTGDSTADYIEVWQTFAVDANKVYQLSAYTGAHRCMGRIFAYFYRADWSSIGNTYSTSADILAEDKDNNNEKGGGGLLKDYKRIWQTLKIPSDAAYLRLSIRKHATSAGAPEPNSYLFVTRVQAVEVPATNNGPVPWTPSASSLGAKVKGHAQSIDSINLAIQQGDDFAQATADDLNALELEVRDPSTGLGTKASITQHNAIKSRLDDTGGGRTIEQVASALVLVENELPNKASTSAFNSLDTYTRQTLAGEVQANATNISGVKAGLTGSGNLMGGTTFTGDVFAPGGIFFGGNLPGSQRTAHVNNAGASWRNGDLNNIGWYVPGQTTSGQYADFYTNQPGLRAAVEGGKWYIASVYAGSHRSNVRFFLRFIDRDGNILYTPQSSVRSGHNGGPLLEDERLFIRVQAPSNAAYAYLILRHTMTGEVNAYSWWTAPMIEQVSEAQLTPSPWSAGGNEYAHVTQMMEANVSNINNRMQATYGLVAQAGGDIAGMQLLAGGGTSAIRFLAESAGFYSSDGAFEISGGRIIVRSGGYMEVRGKPFGASNEFMAWYGPEQSSLSNCRRDNAIFYRTNTGASFQRGGIIAGTRVTSGFNPSLTSPSTYTTPAFSTGGKPITVNASYSYSKTDSTSSSLGRFTAGSGSTQATLQLYRKIGSGSWELVGSLTATGEMTIQSPGDVSDSVTWNISGAIHYIDTAGGTQNRQYELRMTNRQLQGANHNGQGSRVILSADQAVGIITEEDP